MSENLTTWVSGVGPTAHAVAQPSAGMQVRRYRVTSSIGGSAEIAVGEFRLIIPELDALDWLLETLGVVAADWRQALGRADGTDGTGKHARRPTDTDVGAPAAQITDTLYPDPAALWARAAELAVDAVTSSRGVSR